MSKDLKRIISLTSNWGRTQRTILEDCVIIHPENYESYELRHLNETKGTRRLGKNRKRHRNGGGSRNFHYYGNDDKFMRPRRIFTTDYAGKSSRKFHRLKDSWWKEALNDGF